MARRINLLLVRHALSAANLDKRVNMRLPDQRVPLASGFGIDSPQTYYDKFEDGRWQADQTGEAISRLLESDPRFHGRTRILCSPYLRTRQTAEAIRLRMERNGIEYDLREEIALREISFGLFDGYTDEELAERFPLEHAHYQKHLHVEGEGRVRDAEFWASMPLGESRAQVADRVKGVFGTILRDADPERDDPVLNFVIVSHGVTIRAFMMQWMHHPFEWYGQQANPGNASVNHIFSDGLSSYGHEILVEGYDHRHRTAQDRREDGVVL